MQVTKFVLTCAVCLMALPATAQPPADDGGDRTPADPTAKQKLLDAFDANNDGTIDRDEARVIGRALRENFNIGFGRGPADRGPRDRGPRDRDRAGRGPDGRGPDGPPRGDGRGRGPEGRRGPDGTQDRPRGPNPERVFNVFDENDDDSLSKEEFLKLSDFMRSLRMNAGRPPGRGRGFEGRGPDDRPGPPRDGERRGRGGRRPWGDGSPDSPPGPGGPTEPPPLEDGAGTNPESSTESSN